MKEKQFLFRLGLILIPALLAVPAPSDAALVAAAAVLSVAALAGARLATSRLPQGFWQDLAEVVLVAALIGAADWCARTFFLSLWLPLGFYFQLILLNALLALRREPAAVKFKSLLWFSFVLMVFALAGKPGPAGLVRNAFTVFFGTGIFLYGLGICLKKRWCVL
jgi:hypothetical protein